MVVIVEVRKVLFEFDCDSQFAVHSKLVYSQFEHENGLYAHRLIAKMDAIAEYASKLQH